jgi:hypothetical protein
VSPLRYELGFYIDGILHSQGREIINSYKEPRNTLLQRPICSHQISLLSMIIYLMFLLISELPLINVPISSDVSRVFITDL